jgi:hypothetical protein
MNGKQKPTLALLSTYIRRSILAAVVLCCVLSGVQSAVAGGCPSGYAMTSGVCFPSNTGLSSTPVATIIMNVMNWMLAILGFVAVLGFVISGMQYLLSAGDEGMVESAKRNMKYSIIGVVVALSGRVLIMAINNLLNASTLPF